MVDHFKQSTLELTSDDDSDDDDQLVPPKRRRLNEESSPEESSAKGDSTCEDSFNDDHDVSETSSFCSTGMSVGQRILEKLGHKPGRGLGKYGQGITEPVKASDQKGTRGFGFHPKTEVKEVDPEIEGISVKETVNWLSNCNADDEEPDLDCWLVEGPRKLTIDDEIHFCDPKILHDILESKDDFEDIEETTLRKTRSRANPFEAIDRGIFMNRAAVKMANMEKVFDYIFTEPKDKNDKKILGDDELLYFADVCAGPGGFSEYVFFRKKWRAKGFGFTLKSSCDFKLENFFAGPSESFEPHYGEDDDGNIYKPHNIESFTSFVMRNTDNKGVHFMMADGTAEDAQWPKKLAKRLVSVWGFKIQGKSIQEIESKQLYLCQCLVALNIIRPNGNFVVKLFDLFTHFSIGLVYLMYRSFDRIAIHKPNSSRPANSERYLICQYKRADCSKTAKFLSEVNKLLWKWRNVNQDILEIVPRSVLGNHDYFIDYITNSNNKIGRRQIYHLKNVICYYGEKAGLSDERQEKLKMECLEYWDIPNRARTQRDNKSPEYKINQLLENNTEFLYKSPELISDIKSFEQPERSPLDWYWTIIGSEKDNPSLTLYLGLGRSNIYRLEGKTWKKISETNFKLPDETLIFGEIVEEIKHHGGSMRAQYRISVFHIIDGLFLGGEDIRNKHIETRGKLCELFAKSLCQSNVVYRKKKMYGFGELNAVLSESISYRKIKSKQDSFCFDLEENKFFIPRGILLMCGTKDKWNLNFSRTHKENYYFHVTDRRTIWQRYIISAEGNSKLSKDYLSVCADFRTCFEKRCIAWFTEEHLHAWVNEKNDTVDNYIINNTVDSV